MELESPIKRRKLCSLGTGEIVHIVSFKSVPDKIEEFERTIQSLAQSLYHFQSGITDIRVCHPSCGEVCFIITFLTKQDVEKFQNGPEQDAHLALKGLIEDGKPKFEMSGCLMPEAHTLKSLLSYLERNVCGSSHDLHDVRSVQKEMQKWFPRKSEYEKYVHWDLCEPKKYTRNLVFHNENMDVILMCWPAGAVSTIHDHDVSSCWVLAVEGCVHEVQYALPQLDRKFIETEMRNPTGAIGRCGQLKMINEAKLEPGVCSSSYANNDIGIHRVENRTDQYAYTLHVYAPPLTKMKIFKESGEVSVHTVSTVAYSSINGEKNVDYQDDCNEVMLDVEAWNTRQCGSRRGSIDLGTEKIAC
mmetsp:Transcript_4061/g.5213  ORF Transcript_4061/g.5213 Transcript_4061/m.5213 type:complete len:359 (+) Transcript_4061:231-1307(+)